MHQSLLLPILASLPFLIKPAAAGFSIWASFTGSTSCPVPGQCVPVGDQARVGITPVGDASCSNIENFWAVDNTAFIPTCNNGDATFVSGSFRVTNCGFNEIWYGRPGPKSTNGFLVGNTLEIARDPSFNTIAATCFASTSPVSDKDHTCQPMAEAHCGPSGWFNSQQEYWACADSPGFSTCT